MSSINVFVKRCISTSSERFGKRNFKKFPIYNKRGSKIFKQQQMTNEDPDVPIHRRGVRDTGYKDGDKFVLIPQKIPELIVPDLSNCALKPYVSYRAPDVIQSEFTAEDLFNVVYVPKVVNDFKAGKLTPEGQPLEPSNEEKLTAEEALIRARQTGTDIF